MDELVKTLKYLGENLALGASTDNIPDPVTINRETSVLFVIRKNDQQGGLHYAEDLVFFRVITGPLAKKFVALLVEDVTDKDEMQSTLKLL